MGSIIAIGIAVLVPYQTDRNERRRRDEERQISERAEAVFFRDSAIALGANIENVTRMLNKIPSNPGLYDSAKTDLRIDPTNIQTVRDALLRFSANCTVRTAKVVQDLLWTLEEYNRWARSWSLREGIELAELDQRLRLCRKNSDELGRLLSRLMHRNVGT